MKRSGKSAPIVVIGGCGFIGSNLADQLAADGETVTVVDNLSRPGVGRNLDWLQQRHADAVSVEIIDVRAASALRPIISEAKAVFHFAAQTAVTSSLIQPLEDFEINARGTLNVLEAIRGAGKNTPIVFASTNKVYGALADIGTSDADGCHMPTDETIRTQGISETRPLDFSTPYGCSKGAADQYVLDYAKSFGLRTAVLRMSCIYGPRQFGTEDQGWVAHFLIQALAGRPITIFGDGRQVRDVLHVSDAVAAYRAVLADIDRLSGQVFNLGGGPSNGVSLNLVLDEIAGITGRKPDIRRAAPRAGDQRYFVADTSRLREAVGWEARVGWRHGIRNLAEWLGATSAGAAEPQRFVA